MGTYESTINIVLSTVSIILWIFSIIANIRLFQYSARKWSHDRTLSNIVLCAVTVSNLSSCLLAIPTHIAKLMMQNYNVMQGEAYVCLMRYSATMTTTDLTLLFLTVLLIDRHDKIVLVPYGRRPRINSSNKNKCVTIILSVVVISNLVMFVGHMGQIANLGMSPCEKRADQVSRVMTYLASIKTALIAVPCLVVMFKSISKIQHTIKALNNGSSRFALTIRKVRRTYFYCASFLIAWVPFEVMAILGEEVVAQEFYSTWFNIGYTISYGYVLALPLVSALTDRNFYCLRWGKTNMPHSRNMERSSNSNIPSSFSVANFRDITQHQRDFSLETSGKINRTEIKL